MLENGAKSNCKGWERDTTLDDILFTLNQDSKNDKYISILKLLIDYGINTQGYESHLGKYFTEFSTTDANIIYLNDNEIPKLGDIENNI